MKASNQALSAVKSSIQKMDIKSAGIAKVAKVYSKA
jgi:hypothetical protein